LIIYPDFDSVAENSLKTHDNPNRSLTCRQLYDGVTAILHTRLSHGTFNEQLKKMVENRSLHKNDTGVKGKKVFYWLTEKGRKGFKLKIQEKIDLREKAYQLLLSYFGPAGPPILPINHGRNILENEKELEQFLSKEFNLSTKYLKVDSVRYTEDKYRVTRMIEPIHNIQINRIDHLKGSKRLEGKYEYRYILPGISVREALRGIREEGISPLEYIRPSVSQPLLEEWFELLVKESLIKKIMAFHGESRFDIVDSELKGFLEHCWNIFGIASFTMNFIWKNARKPTEEESQWCEMFWGKWLTNNYMNAFYTKRKTLPQRKDKKGYYETPKDIEGYIRNWGYRGIVEQFQSLNEKYSRVIDNYSALSDMLIKMVYPEFLHKLIEKNEI
jgi:DNA-binding PadR family transcriptional regulator